MASERGSGSILAVAIVAVFFAALALLVPLMLVLGAKQVAAGAADAAALAAADAAIGIRPGPPCPIADAVASANGAAVTDCRVDGVVVTVRVSVPAAGFQVLSAASAGPPDSGAD